MIIVSDNALYNIYLLPLPVLNLPYFPASTHLLIVILVLPASKFRLRQPAQLIMNFRQGNCIPQVMAFPVCHLSDQAFTFPKFPNNKLHDINVPYLVVAAYIMNFANATFSHNQVNRLAVILRIQPVTNIQPFPP